jgi:hypothetical protein
MKHDGQASSGLSPATPEVEWSEMKERDGGGDVAGRSAMKAELKRRELPESGNPYRRQSAVLKHRHSPACERSRSAKPPSDAGVFWAFYRPGSASRLKAMKPPKNFEPARNFTAKKMNQNYAFWFTSKELR